MRAGLGRRVPGVLLVHGANKMCMVMACVSGFNGYDFVGVGSKNDVIVLMTLAVQARGAGGVLLCPFGLGVAT